MQEDYFKRDAEYPRSALCWSYARRKFFALADIAGTVPKNKPAHDISPVALDAVKWIDSIFDVGGEINGMNATARRAVGQDRCPPMVEEPRTLPLEERARTSKYNSVDEAIDDMASPDGGRWEAFTAFLEDARLCLIKNAARYAPLEDSHQAGSLGFLPDQSAAATGRPACRPGSSVAN